MKHHFRSLLSVAMMGVTVTTVLLLWASAFAAHLSPEHFGWYGVLTLLFPVFASVNAATLVFWLFFYRRYAIVPLLGFIFCISDLRAYCPVNIPQRIPGGCIKVMSYNAANFDGTDDMTPEKRSIINNILRSGADIVCIQEGDYWADWNKVEPEFRKVYPYMTVDGQSREYTTMRCFSRFPILSSERFTFSGSTNASEAYTVKLPSGDTVMIVSCHLQSYIFTPAELANYSDIMSGRKSIDKGESKVEFLSLLRKLSVNTEKRAVQVDSVSRFIRSHGDFPLIVCGDFNDTPVSYAHRVLSRSLTDAFISTGCGPGYTYYRHKMHVRIDNLLCSHAWKAYGARVERHMTGSDHYPVTAFFKLKKK